MLYVNLISIFFLSFILSGCISSPNKVLEVKKEVKREVEKPKKKVKTFAYFRKQVYYSAKLKKCGINFEAWDDRKTQDLKLAPKLLSVCKDINTYVVGNVIHSSKKKLSKPYGKKKHIFIPYHWTEKKLLSYFNKEGSSKFNHKQTAKKPSDLNTHSVVEVINKGRVLSVGN